MTRLAGKRLVVTGAGSGLGRAAALRFAREGGEVLCADLDLDAAEELADEIVADGGHAVAVQVDVTDEAATEAMARAAVSELGGIDVLYANAGIDGVGRAHEITREAWDHVIAINLTGVWLSFRAALPVMLEAGGGSLIAQASVGGLIGVPRIASYAAAKGGVIALTRQIAVDYGRRNIRANAICPGVVWTRLVERTVAGRAATVGGGPDEAAARIADEYPLGRLGVPEDVASLATYLASDESAWVTGAHYVIDGGLTAR